MALYAGIDLHSNNNYTGIIDQKDKRVFRKKLSNDEKVILMALEPYKKELQGVVVESTFNWYWLIDLLQENGYKVHLANPSAIKQYEGLKHTDDRWDSFWLAHMLRLGILPEGYIYPKENRPIRDLLRRRIQFVNQRTSQILSFQSMVARNLAKRISVNDLKKLSEQDAEKMFESTHLSMTAVCHISTVQFLTKVVRKIEKEVLSNVKLSDEFRLLTTVPGIGNILAMTIMLEVGDIGRFPHENNYSSYCRCVKSERLSNGKKKGENNRKNGNRYLAWAYTEAANFAKRYCPAARKFHQRKKAATNNTVATKALSNKLTKATWHMMKHKVAYDPVKLFG
jgi:transposase